MDAWRPLLLLIAGVGAGLTGSIAGLASLISYPALLGAGLAPVTANVTNTVALVFSGVGSVAGSRPELRGQADRVRRLGVVGVAGGLVGGALLLSTPDGAFEKVVPWLIGFGSLTILAVVFVLFGSVDWVATVPLAVGLFVGGRTGPIIIRHAPARPLRLLIAAAGIGLAGYLGVTAY